MMVVLLTGAAAGAGLWLLILALAPRRPSLAESLARIDVSSRSARAGYALTTAPSSRLAAARWALGDRLAREWSERGWLGEALRANLSLLQRPESEHFATKLLWSAGGFLWVPLIAALVRLGGAAVPLVLPAWLALLFGAVAFLVPDRQVARQAAERRRDFSSVMGVFLDLVAMKMASGAGLAESVRDAANVGHGWAFARVRAALEDARTDGISPAAALGRLGEELDVADLRDLAASLSLVDAAGAQAEASLRAKAESLRSRELSDAHGTANERSQTMRVAHVILATGFLLFLGYPAFSIVMNG
jgi:tight adherence protein C